MKIFIKTVILIIIFNISITKECDSNCLDCNKQGCVQCKTKYIMYNNLCYYECPMGTYNDEKWQTCRKCSSICPVCWGPTSDNCGLIKGVSSKIVFIENQILKDISKFTIAENDINKWIINLKLILKNRGKYILGNIDSDNALFKIEDQNNNIFKTMPEYFKERKMSFLNNSNSRNSNISSMSNNFFGPLKESRKINKNNDDLISNVKISEIESNRLLNNLRLKESQADIVFSPNEIYSTKNFNINLPLGSFSKFDGVFIPIPSYIFKNIIVETHWIFVKGQYSGNNWNTSWNPNISVYLKNYGDKNLIYYENQGFWVFSNENWTWIKDKKPLMNNDYNREEIDLILSNLNSFIFGNVNSLIRFRYENQKIIKRENLRQNISTLINNLKYDSKIAIEKISDKLNKEKDSINHIISNLKGEVNEYLKEEETLMNSFKLK